MNLSFLSIVVLLYGILTFPCTAKLVLRRFPLLSPVRSALLHSSISTPNDDAKDIAKDTNANYEPIAQEVNKTDIDYTNIHQLSLSTVDDLLRKYPGRLVCAHTSLYSHCDIYLCGTMHVSKASLDLVKESIQCIRPNFVVLELCEDRLSTLEEHDSNATATSLRQILSSVLRERRFKDLGIELIGWMQQKAANLLGSKVGGEQCMAAREGYQTGAAVVLGDRKYSITMQRMMDKLTLLEKMKISFILICETLTITVLKLRDYLQKSEADSTFIEDEIEQFTKHLPNVADVLISERDEYIAQTIHEVAERGFGPTPPPGATILHRGAIVAVIGAAHLSGVVRCLRQGKISPRRIREIASSSEVDSTWPGEGLLHVVNTTALYATPANQE